MAASKASNTVVKQEQELDVASYWLDVVDGKVKDEVKEARKAANSSPSSSCDVASERRPRSPRFS